MGLTVDLNTMLLMALDNPREHHDYQRYALTSKGDGSRVGEIYMSAGSQMMILLDQRSFGFRLTLSEVEDIQSALSLTQQVWNRADEAYLLSDEEGDDAS